MTAVPTYRLSCIMFSLINQYSSSPKQYLTFYNHDLFQSEDKVDEKCE